MRRSKKMSKGHWIKLSDTPNGLHRYKCSECECIFALHSEYDILNYHFSPCCGSPMKDYEDEKTRDYWKWVNEE